MKTKLLFLSMMLCALKLSAQGLTGSGTSDDPYLINTVEDLKWMRDQVNMGSESYDTASYKLMDDLDFSAEGDGTPIGRIETYRFKGSFDGNSKVIKNIKIGTKDTAAKMSYAGLFGYVVDVTISDLGVEWSGLYSTFTSAVYAGGIVGSADNCTITNCYTTGDISSSSYYASISDSYNFDSYSYTGGIVGYADKCTVTS